MRSSRVERCGPCHRRAGGQGYPTMALPNRPDLDAHGGIHAFCEGVEPGTEHMAHLDYLGEPFSPVRLAEIVATREEWPEPQWGHSLIA